MRIDFSTNFVYTAQLLQTKTETKMREFHEATSNEHVDLWFAVKQFIEDNDISCEETIYQTDRVVENALDFIAKLANIVGYIEYDE